ncbi:hypothetical protein KDK77_07460, partial [bacterium]|nr:hypothetical protein [bacterium]
MTNLFKIINRIEIGSVNVSGMIMVVKKYSLFILLLPVFFIIIIHAQTESNWPRTGYTAYRVLDNNGDIIVLRDPQDHLAGKMVLAATGADYHNPASVVESIVYFYDDTLRWGYNDANKNGLLDGVHENFESYEVGDRPKFIDESRWFAAGGGLQDSSIKVSGNNKYLHLVYNSAENDNAFVLGYLHKEEKFFNP